MGEDMVGEVAGNGRDVLRGKRKVVLIRSSCEVLEAEVTMVVNL